MNEPGDAMKSQPIPAGDEKRRRLAEQIPDRVPIMDDPVVAVAPEVLARYNARILDPATARRVADHDDFRSTVYIADKLLISGAARQFARTALDTAAKTLHLELHPPAAFDERRNDVVRSAVAAGIRDAEQLFVSVHEVRPQAGIAAVPDAWDVLQTFRSNRELSAEDVRHVGLDHLLTACKHVSGSPFEFRGGSQAPAAASYGLPGWGGRQPVNWLGGPPNRRAKVDFRRPVVAVLDTGVGDHEWFPFDAELDEDADVIVHRNQDFNGQRIGLGEPSATERTGVVDHPLEGTLDNYSGHGTFIAGLIHQQCPDADILSVRIMPSEGAVPEHALHEALVLLLCRQQAAQASTDKAVRDAQTIDVVSLSLGYYPEHLAVPGSPPPFLYEPIDALGRCGVAVVVAAGNDSTTRPMYPAAFTPYPDGYVTAVDPRCVPVVSVGAKNPDGSIALFSNAGDWVACKEAGAALVSTFPKFNASGLAAYGFRAMDGFRSTIDPDDFAAGFGVWSGTSFAAPVLAGKIAKLLIETSETDDVTDTSMIDRGRVAVQKLAQVPK